MRSSAALLPLCLLLVSCATVPQLEWSDDWVSREGTQVKLAGVLFNSSDSQSYLCPFHVTEDLNGCVQLINSRTGPTPLRRLHDQCVVATGWIKSASPAPAERRLSVTRAALDRSYIVPCEGSNYSSKPTANAAA